MTIFIGEFYNCCQTPHGQADCWITQTPKTPKRTSPTHKSQRWQRNRNGDRNRKGIRVAIASQTMCAVCFDDQEFCLKTWPTDQLAISVLNTSAEAQPRPRASLRADAAGASATMVKAAATGETGAAAATTLRDVSRKSAKDLEDRHGMTGGVGASESRRLARPQARFGNGDKGFIIYFEEKRNIAITLNLNHSLWESPTRQDQVVSTEFPIRNTGTDSKAAARSRAPEKALHEQKCKDNTSNDPFSRCKSVQQFGYR